MAECGVLDLPDADLDIVSRILETHVPDRPVFIFGSRVTGRARHRSDLDLAIGGDTPLSLSLEGDLREAFSESDLPIRVDVVDLATASAIFRRRIESHWIPFAAAEQRQARAGVTAA